MGRLGYWDRAVPAMSEDALMLAESNHRTANEVAAAIAALRLVGPARGSKARWSLLSRAIERLEAFGAVHIQLSAPAARRMNVGAELDRLCSSLAAARDSPAGTVLDLRAPKVFVDGETGRRLLMIANELVTNALRYALSDRAGRITVGVGIEALHVKLTVSDDGPGMDPSAPARGTGLGTPLVAELVRRAGGRLVKDSDPDGTRIEVILPFDPAAMESARAT